MRAVFADTFYWIALTLPAEKAHRRTGLFAGKIVTTDEVLSEYLTFFSNANGHLRHEAAANVRDILQDENVWVVPQAHESFVYGLELYQCRLDKGYSLTDCISMQTMRTQKLTEALTNDRHFEQEGFRALFRSVTH